MAVFTPVAPSVLKQFLRQYDAGELVAMHGLADGVENTNYLVETTRQKLILTVFEGRVQAGDVPWFLTAMQFLAGKGIPCPLPLSRLDGGLAGTIKGKPATLVTFLTGAAPEVITDSICFALGAFLAQLHLTAQDHQPPRQNGMNVIEWQRLVDRVGGQADGLQSGLAADLQAELAFIAQHPLHNLPGGFIHGDVFPDNVFFTGEQLTGIIDFYFACHDAWLYDLAVCLNAWAFDGNHGYNAGLGSALLAGYQGVRPLLAAEREALPVMARMTALRFIATRLHDWFFTPANAAVKRKDPLDYVHRLRFHRQAKAFGDYENG